MINFQIDNQKQIEILQNSDIRTFGEFELPSPADVYDYMSKLGEVKLVKTGSKVTGKNEDYDDVMLLNDYLIEVKLTDNNEFFGIVGILVQQNSNKMQVYSGLNAHACLNLSIFGADYVKSIKGIDIEVIKALGEKAGNNLILQAPRIIEQVDELTSITYNQETWNHKLGKLLREIPSSLQGYLVNGVNELNNKQSIYYDQPLTDWLLLSAMTDKIKNDSVPARVNKTVALEKLFV